MGHRSRTDWDWADDHWKDRVAGVDEPLDELPFDELARDIGSLVREAVRCAAVPLREIARDAGVRVGAQRGRRGAWRSARGRGEWRWDGGWR